LAPIYVALDLETTGLDPEQEEIIEVGAVRFSEAGVEETFHTLVNPRRPLSYRIQLLTGIALGELEGAPFFAEVASELEAFIGAQPVVGQNVAFDLGFLARQGIVPPGPTYDTYELVSLLLPELSERSLGSIARHLGVEFPVQHRALADALAAQQVFLALRARLAALPPELLAEAERIASSTDWPLRYLLREVSAERPALPGVAVAEADGLIHGVVRRPSDPGPSPVPSERVRPVEPNEVVAILESAGRRPGIIHEFEERSEQLRMAGAVAEVLNDGQELIVEAGTGIGKSLAYLIPAACYALRNGTRAVVSTNTISLQEQLMGQDIPIVRRLLEGWSADGEPFEPEELRVAQLKGRRNYLCLLRWAALRHSSVLNAEEARMLVRLLLWLPRSETGDRAEINLTQAEEPVWNRLNAQNESCLTALCPYVRDGSCFLLRARKRAEASHLLVVNHALLLSDVAAGGNVLPGYAHLVVDEAQHLEDEATNQFGFHTGEGEITRLLDRAHERVVGREGGLAVGLRSATRGLASRLGVAGRLREHAGALASTVERVRGHLPDLFALLADFLRQQARDEGGYDQRLLISRAMRVQPDWAGVETAWEGLDLGLKELLDLLEEVRETLTHPEASALLDYEALLAEVSDLVQSGQRLRDGLAAIIAYEDPDVVCWLTANRVTGVMTLASAPLQVADALQAGLFAGKESSVLTSATLSTEGQFDYIRERLGLSGARELLLGSPFDYARSTVVLIPQDMPEPNELGYAAALQDALIEICRASQGRALVLFTSYAALKAAYFGIKGTLEEEEILVQGHGIDGSPKQLLNILRQNPRTVVLGTASFWEGVDVVGEALSLLVMARLPFSVPTDPVFQARSDLYDESFTQYALPQAVLRFKQGFGRLIRRKTDRGAMVVLDRRVRSKSYGSAFLHSLPACTVQEAPLRELPGLASEWLAREG